MWMPNRIDFICDKSGTPYATYNYGSLTWVDHWLFDVYPYWKWGSSHDDTTKWYERIVGAR